MKIAKNTVVQIHYTMTSTDGAAFDTSRNGEPLEYLHGHNNLICGLEDALEGKSTEDSFSVTLLPESAYGVYDERLVAEVPRLQFDSDIEIKEGMKFQADTIAGPTIVRVKKVSDDTVTIDANHELAGKTLNFDVEVVSVREATEAELAPSPSGCGGGCGGCHGCNSSDDETEGCSSCGCGGCH